MKGRYGIHGGQYIPETLMSEIHKIEEAYEFYKNAQAFNDELNTLLKEYAGRPSLLYYAKKMTEDLGGAKIYLKREDLNHTGSHKINNVLGQALMAKKMGTRHTIARVRNPDYSSQRDFMRNQLGFSMIVNPEFEAASEICRVLSFPSAVKVDTFSRGKVELAEFFVENHSRLNGVELNQLHKITKTNILVCAVSHNEDVIIPDGNYAIKPGDHLYITGTHRDLSRFCLNIGVITNRIKNVIIVVGIKTCFIF